MALAAALRGWSRTSAGPFARDGRSSLRLFLSAAIRSTTWPCDRHRPALDGDPLALGLGLDQLAQGRLVMVDEPCRIEGGGLALDQLPGQGQLVLVERTLLDLGEVGRALLDLLRGAQGLEQHALAAGLERHEALAPRQHHLAQGDLALVLQRLADHLERFLRHLAVGHQEVGLLVVERVDLAGADELDQVDGVLALDPDRLELVVGEGDVAVLGDLVALDDLVLVDRPHAGHGLLVAHPLPARPVDLVEADPRAGRGGAEQLDRERDQRQPDMPLPVGAWRHGILPLAVNSTTRGKAGMSQPLASAVTQAMASPALPFHRSAGPSARKQWGIRCISGGKWG